MSNQHPNRNFHNSQFSSHSFSTPKYTIQDLNKQISEIDHLVQVNKLKKHENVSFLILGTKMMSQVI